MPPTMRTLPLALLVAAASCAGPEANVKSADPYERYLGVVELGEDREAGKVAEHLQDRHYLVVTGALEALAKIGDTAFLQHPVAVLHWQAPKDDPLSDHPYRHPMVRSQACATISAIRNPDGVAVLLAALSEPEAAVRRAAVKALATFGRLPQAVEGLVAAVGDKDPSVGLMAHEKLRELTGKGDVVRTSDAWKKALAP